MLTQEQLTPLADRLVQVSGIVGVMLGGSRARDDLAPDSDYDLGLYLGRREDSLGAAVDAAEQLVADVSRSCRR